MITQEMIIALLRKAASIKDRIEPLCSKDELYYKGRTKGYEPCFKCYPELRKTHKIILKRPAKIIYAQIKHLPICSHKCSLHCR